MKQCPQCNRIEIEDTLKFCRLDGTPLVAALASESESATMAVTRANIFSPRCSRPLPPPWGKWIERSRSAQQSLDDKDPLFVLLARTWPDYGPLRKESRFLEIVSHLALPGWSITS